MIFIANPNFSSELSISFFFNLLGWTGTFVY